MTVAKTKRGTAAASKTGSARPTRAKNVSRDPYAAEKRRYIKEMIDHGFELKDALIIAEKTNYKSFKRYQQVEREHEPALGDFFSNLTPPPSARSFVLPPKPAPEPKPARRKIEKPVKAFYDFRYDELPERVKDLIEAHLAIEANDAKAAGNMGFMARALTIATLPHRSVDSDRFIRRNGDFTLTMMTAHPEGLPSGTLPRILLSWVCTEAVLTQDPVLSLGDNLADTLRELGLRRTGGAGGDITRLKRAMTTLFSAVISCHYEGRDSWALSNVLLADRVQWWQPQDKKEAGSWQSKVVLSQAFFKECIEHPVPVNLIALKALRHSSLALDIYIWLTHRMSYLSKRTTIPWISLAGQFGANYALNQQGLRDFKRAFLRELTHVVTVYQQAKVAASDTGLVLYPSAPHVPPRRTVHQPRLPF